MKTKRLIPLTVLLGLMVGCGQLPQTQRHSVELTDWRAQYIKHNPEGPYNRYIVNGQVARGMNALEVLASWGVPNYRLRVAENDAEYWTYYESDIHTEDVTTYAFVFEHGVISAWVEGAGKIRLDTLSPKDLASMFAGSGTGESMAGRSNGASTPLGGGR